MLIGVVATPCVRAEYEPADRILASVEDEVVLESEVEEQLQLLLLELGMQDAAAAAVDSLRQEVLGQLIDSILIVKEAEKQGIKVSPEELDSYVEEQVREQTERLGGDEEFRKQLAREGLTLAQVRAIYREDVRRQVLSSKLVGSQIDTDVEITDADVRSYFAEKRETLPPKPAQVRVRHLLIVPKPALEREEAARDELARAYDRLRAGESFAALAEEYSQDPSARRGGDIGFFSRGDIADTVFTEIAFALPDSGISEVVRTLYGYHIIQRLETRGDEIRARHIVVPMLPSPEDIERVRTLMDTIIRRLREGADFVEMVRMYSDAPEADGDVGYYPLSGLFPHVRAAVDTLDVGEVSSSVEDPQGFHLFQLIDRIGETTYSYEEIAPRLREYLRREMLEKRYREWTEELRQRSYVHIRELSAQRQG
jgi:peptidyl-prolyl cis-trans isomerase SurA